jgi:hypothetical protein
MRDAWEGTKEWLRDVEGVNESIEDIHQLQMLVSIISTTKYDQRLTK